MAIFGGRQGNTYLNDGAFYDPITDKWTLIPSQDATFFRGSHSSAWIDEKLLIWGGYFDNDGEASLTSKGYLYDSTEEQWQKVATDNEPTARSRFPILNIGTGVLIWGGSHQLDKLKDGAILKI